MLFSQHTCFDHSWGFFHDNCVWVHVCTSYFVRLSANSLSWNSQWGGILWRATICLMVKCCNALASCGALSQVKIFITDNVSVKHASLATAFYRSFNRWRWLSSVLRSLFYDVFLQLGLMQMPAPPSLMALVADMSI